MKKLIVLVLVLLAVWVGVNFVRTGQISLFPAATSPEQQRLQELEADLKAVDAQIEQAGRAAGLTGVDTTGDVGALQAKKEMLQKQIEEARAKVK
jgi:peptidoglycan hydrolase CwlO-like protein